MIDCFPCGFDAERRFARKRQHFELVDVTFHRRAYNVRYSGENLAPKHDDNAHTKSIASLDEFVFVCRLQSRLPRSRQETGALRLFLRMCDKPPATGIVAHKGSFSSSKTLLYRFISSPFFRLSSSVFLCRVAFC